MEKKERNHQTHAQTHGQEEQDWKTPELQELLQLLEQMSKDKYARRRPKLHAIVDVIITNIITNIDPITEKESKEYYVILTDYGKYGYILDEAEASIYHVGEYMKAKVVHTSSDGYGERFILSFCK